MISDTHIRSGSTTRTFANHVAMLAAILLVWFLTMAASARFLPVSDNYLAIGPERSMVENLPVTARILRTGNHVVVVNMTDGPGGKSLYQAGAWMVLPALANGCLALRER